jgi:hypothetical protein
MAAGEKTDSDPIRLGAALVVVAAGLDAVASTVSGSAKSGREKSVAPASAAAAKIRFVGMWDKSLCSSEVKPPEVLATVIKP